MHRHIVKDSIFKHSKGITSHPHSLASIPLTMLSYSGSLNPPIIMVLANLIGKGEVSSKTRYLKTKSWTYNIILIDEYQKKHFVSNQELSSKNPFISFHFLEASSHSLTQSFRLQQIIHSLFSLFRLYRLYRLCRLNRLYRLYRLCRLYRLYKLYRLYRFYILYKLYRLYMLYRLCRLYKL